MRPHRGRRRPDARRLQERARGGGPLIPPPIEVAHPVLPRAGRLFAGPMPRMPFDESLGRLRAAGVTTVISLIEGHESRNDLDTRYRRAGFAVVRYPIRDYGVPADDATFGALLEDLAARLTGGERVYVHCVGGIGRTGTVIACLLKRLGVDGDAVAVVRTIYLATAVESPEQRRFVHDYGGPRYGPPNPPTLGAPRRSQGTPRLT